MTRAFVMVGPGEIRCVDADTPASAGAEVELEACLVGPRDARLIRGEGRPRGYRGSSYPHPLGSSAIGRLRKLDDACRQAGLEVGARVVVSDAGRMRQAFSVPGRLVHPIDASVDMLRAATVAEVAEAVRAVRCSGLEPGETLAVVGLAAAGLQAIPVARASGAAAVHGVDADASVRDLARERGADLVFAPEEYPAWLGGDFERAPMRVVQFDPARGSVGLALRVAGRRGVIVTAGMPDEDPVVLHEYYKNAIHRELTLVGAYGTERQDWLDAIRLVESGCAAAPAATVEVKLTEDGARDLARLVRGRPLHERVLVIA